MSIGSNMWETISDLNECCFYESVVEEGITNLQWVEEQICEFTLVNGRFSEAVAQSYSLCSLSD